MNSKLPDHSTLREWLYLEPDGELTSVQRSRLQQHLTTCLDCRNEHRELLALNRLLAESRVAVHADFGREVMAGLPSAGWEARSPRSWLAAAVAVILLSIGAGLLIGFSTAEVESAVPIATLSAVWGLVSSSALAGAGLIAASWKGLGIAFQQVLGQSVWNMIAFGVLVFFLDLVLIRILLRRRTAGAKAETDSHSS